MIQFISCNIVGNRFMQCAHIKYNSKAILLKTSITAEKKLNILHLLVIDTSNYLLTVIWQKSFRTFWTEEDQKNFSFQTFEKIISNLTVAKNPSRSLQFPCPHKWNRSSNDLKWYYTLDIVSAPRYAFLIWEIKNLFSMYVDQLHKPFGSLNKVFFDFHVQLLLHFCLRNRNESFLFSLDLNETCFIGVEKLIQQP